MKIDFGAWVFLALATMCAQPIRFDHSPPGALPSDWTAGMTHKGGPPKWEILPDSAASPKSNVLAQTSADSTGGRFPFAIYNGAVVKDGSVSVRFKTISGKVDQAAGVVWRFRDADNYYVVRANALEDNVVLYKVEKGERVSLAPKNMPSRTYGVKHTVPRQKWNTLKVEFNNARFAVFLDGQRIMELEDTTFSQAGKTGVWTKADSVVYFNDFQVIENGKK
jgi:hypothetical protein